VQQFQFIHSCLFSYLENSKRKCTEHYILSWLMCATTDWVKVRQGKVVPVPN
jgi:hypothetical protein